MTLRAAALALVLIPTLGLAHSLTAHAATTADVSNSTAKAIDDRIAALKARLAINAAETPAWDAFAQAMRDNAAATDAVFAQRAQTAKTMNALQNMQSYAQVAHAYADNTQKLADAFATVYGQLSVTQKQTADTLFREQATTTAK
ncbi:Spy/CpxP family protein refolding chaperone [Acidisoma cellulosilytica]|uniref:Spy/CpxP family protein refolding chaperone n=1 Tax=Acidisoma cellulosilyticum TaxID=2802395 RepID=A0A963Z372_9PROT|nr:Spy/CpxP family protein refolding chaperone [Acidisoma cellulosilyticum]MCB8882007.1 Spy/CpxP family protein refolding chaperone [Acidisoma cellulosilyticum]